jgi:site-specific DNA recombinase
MKPERKDPTMMTIAYCRVSTEEQAAEGYSIDGQTAKLTAYADLHDLGDVTVIEDPGASGKNTNRPGLQRLIAMVEAGHVDHILLWRLDRLSSRVLKFG